MCAPAKGETAAAGRRPELARIKALVQRLADQKDKRLGEAPGDQSVVDGVLNKDVGG